MGVDVLSGLTAELEEAGVRPGDRIGVACSGGGDSTALLLLLAETEAYVLHVLHVDHGLRPGSDDEAGAVAELASRLEVPWTVLSVEVPRAPRTSLEAAAREARYAALERAADELGLRWIVTAHTRDDQAETVLLRILRGTGVGGLAGIAPVRGRVVRPLLGVGREELRDVLVDRGASWHEDPTNDDLSHDRNWVRRVVLPLLAERREGVSGTLARLARLAGEDDELLASMADEVVGASDRGDGWVVLRALEVPRPVLARAVMASLRSLDVRSDEAVVGRVLGLVDTPPGSRAPCAGDVEAWRLESGIAILHRELPAPGPVALPPGVTVAPTFGVRVRVGVDRGTAPWSWRAAVPRGELTLRSRRPGDRVRTDGGTKKVQDVLVDAKVPRPLRGRVPVLVRSGEPVALVGWTSPRVGSSSGAPRDGEAVIVDVDPLRGDLWAATGLWNPARLRATS